MKFKIYLITVLLYLLSLILPGSLKAAETLSFVHQDHLGSTTLMTDSQGKKTSKQVYFPYGETRATEGDLSTEKQYTGQISDSDDTGLLYYNARYYDPVIGKFTQADTADSGSNRYSYVNNNPLKFIDPSGHQTGCPFWETSCLKEAFRSDMNAIKETVTGFIYSLADNPEETTDALALNALQVVGYGLTYIYAGEQAAEIVDNTLCVATGGGAACALAAQTPGPHVRSADNVSDYKKWLGSQGVNLELAPNPKMIGFGPAAGQYYGGTSWEVGSGRVTIFPSTRGNYPLEADVVIHEMGHAKAAWGQVPSNNNLMQLYANECINCSWTIKQLKERGFSGAWQLQYQDMNFGAFRKEVWATGGLRAVNGQFYSGRQLLDIVDVAMRNPWSLRNFPSIAQQNFSYSAHLIGMSYNDAYRRNFFPD